MVITNPLAIFMVFIQMGATVWEISQGRYHLAGLWFLYGLANVILGFYPK